MTYRMTSKIIEESLPWESYIPVNASKLIIGTFPTAGTNGKFDFFYPNPNPGDLMLIRQQSFVENGQKVVALIDDEATVKEFQYKGEVVPLLPRSTNSKHKPIILEREFQIQGIIITTIPNIKI